MTTEKHIIRRSETTRVLAPVELNARRVRKAFTAPLDPPHHALEPARTGRRTVIYPGRPGDLPINR